MEGGEGRGANEVELHSVFGCIVEKRKGMEGNRFLVWNFKKKGRDCSIPFHYEHSMAGMFHSPH